MRREGRFLRPRAAFFFAPGLITRVSGEDGQVEALGQDGGSLSPLLLAPSPTPWNWSPTEVLEVLPHHRRLGPCVGSTRALRDGSGRGWSPVGGGGQ